jgi:cobalt-zinc-cadmium efflux system outer membrane protein
VVVALAWLAWATGPAAPGWAGHPAVPAEPVPPVLSLDAAVGYALRNNPLMVAQRQQYGIAAAMVVIADTYPFNPSLENRVQAASGPESAGITNQVPLEHLLLWEVEVRGQGRYRRRGARAALARTDWEIAQQEQALVVRVLRAFTAVLYRQERLRLAEETLRFNEQLVEQVRLLVRRGQLRGADLLLAQTEATATRAVVNTERETLVIAQSELRSALGVVGGTFQIRGNLEPAPAPTDPAVLTQAAFQGRAELHAREAAVTEAEANLRLAVANQYGNPVVGPAFTYDPTRVSLIGAQINIPLPVVNTHRGEIQQRQAERERAALDLREAEVSIQQDVLAALARLQTAQAQVQTIRDLILPELRRALEAIERLFRAGEPGVDVLRVLDVRRKLLQARGSYLDALYNVSQAWADLVAAVGPTVRDVGACAPPAPPMPVSPAPTH